LPGAALEVEVKLAGGDPDLARTLARRRELFGYTLVDRGAEKLETLYLDTRDFALARAGVVLRVRRGGGKLRLSLKGMGRVQGTRHERPEIEFAARRLPRFPWTRLPNPVAPYLAVHVAGRPLAPVLVTTVSRHTFELQRRGDGREGTVAELVCDAIEIRPGRGRARPLVYREVELEQKPAAAPRELEDIARRLRESFHLRPATRSKFEAGMARFYLPERWKQQARPGGSATWLSAWRRWQQADVALRLGEGDLRWLAGVLPGRARARAVGGGQGAGRARPGTVLRALASPRYARLLRALQRAAASGRM
jgi:inorganic triphosphatase YgiF